MITIAICDLLNVFFHQIISNCGIHLLEEFQASNNHRTRVIMYILTDSILILTETLD